MKAVIYILILMLIWIIIIFGLISFYTLTTNVCNWSEGERGCLIFAVLVYIVFSPLIFLTINDGIDK